MVDRIRTILVEDEPLARAGLLSYIHELGIIDLVEICENALEANEALIRHQPDLMFLDIQMPKMTGIEFLKSLPTPPLVVFTTAFPNYALQGFDLDVVDYLVKPYPFERFMKAINKVHQLLNLKNQPAIETALASKSYFYVKTDNKLERINFEDILFIEAMENYVSIFTLEGKVITLMTMKAMEALLPPERFLRIHKTYIIAMDKVQSIQGNEVRIGNKLIPFSRQNREVVLKRLTGKA